MNSEIIDPLQEMAELDAKIAEIETKLEELAPGSVTEDGIRLKKYLDERQKEFDELLKERGAAMRRLRQLGRIDGTLELVEDGGGV